MPWMPISDAHRCAFNVIAQNPDVQADIRNSRVSFALTSRDNGAAAYSLRPVRNFYPGRPLKYRVTVEDYTAGDSSDKEGLAYTPARFVVHDVSGQPALFQQGNEAAPWPDATMPSADPVAEFTPGVVIIDTPAQNFAYDAGYTGASPSPEAECDTAWTHLIEVWVDDDMIVPGGDGANGDADARVWPIPPDWNEAVSETLAWGTNVAVSSGTASSEHVGYQLGPQRGFGFEVACFRRGDRQTIDMLVAGHRGVWLLPIWPDVQRLAAALAAGEDAITCRTDGFDFVAGGKALLWAAPTRWEVLEIDAVESGGLTLYPAVAAAWPAGTRLYPLRRARLQDGAEERLMTDRASRRKLAFDIDEPCDWPALESLPLYFTHPVLEARPDESEAPTASYARLRQGSNYPGALPFTYDLADQALRAQSTAWKLVGRARHTWHRSLLYLLAGRAKPVWLPSFAADLIPAAAVAGGSNALSIEWAGYTQLGKGRHNRRDLRIELVDGTVHYRRVTDAVEAGATETLTLSAALDSAAIAQAQIRQVSFMALATLAGDGAEITHVTDADGTATATLGWQATVPDA